MCWAARSARCLAFFILCVPSSSSLSASGRGTHVQRRLKRAPAASNEPVCLSADDWSQPAWPGGDVALRQPKAVVRVKNVAPANVSSPADIAMRSLSAIANLSAEFAAVSIFSIERSPREQRRFQLFVGDAEAVVVSFGPLGHPPAQYGHIWEYGQPFFQRFVLPRMQRTHQQVLHAQQQADDRLSAARPAQSSPHPIAPAAHQARRPLRVVIPAGASGCEFKQLAAMFSGLGLTLERASWVPLCHVWGCERRGSVPRALRGAIKLVVLLLSNSSPPLGMLPFPFRDGVHEANGLQRGGAHFVEPDTIVFIRRGTNGRQIWREAEVVRAAREWAAGAHPSLRFMQFRGSVNYADQIRLFARTRLLIGLFGSGLHNCRLMPAGSVVVEIHGALRNDFQDDYGYYNLCANTCGLRHVHLVVEDAHPRYASKTPTRRAVAPYELAADGVQRYNPAIHAYVEPLALVRMLGTVFPQEEAETTTAALLAGRRGTHADAGAAATGTRLRPAKHHGAIPWAELFREYDAWVDTRGNGRFGTLKHNLRALRPPASAWPAQYGYRR
jgi:hypothetical protein